MKAGEATAPAHPARGSTDGLGALPEPYGLLLGPAGERPPLVDAALAAPTVERVRQAIETAEGSREGALWRAVLRVWLAYLTADPTPAVDALDELPGVLADPAAPLEHGAAALLTRGVITAERREDTQAVRDLRMASELYDAATCYRESAVARLALARQLAATGDAAAARAELDRALATLRPDVDAVEYAAVAAGAGGVRLGLARDDAERAAALECHRAALRALPAGERPLLRARVEAGLGAALLTGGGEAREAAALLQRALAVLEPPGVTLPAGLAVEAAVLRLHLGTALQTVPGALPAAIDSYHRALRVLTREDHPREYALIHANLATGYLSGADGGERDALRHALAVQSYEEALRVYTAEDYPAEHAMVQNNLANALQFLPSAHPVDNLDRAIRAYRAALSIRTREAAPLEHARTQANLGVALRNFPAADRREVLADAHAAFSTALEIFRAHGCGPESEIVAAELRDVATELARLSRGEREAKGEPR